jgi:23S rRNA pseudouridine2605 synthase
MTRLQKLLASAGIGSRRQVEQWIREGRLTVGGRLAQLGDRAVAGEEICLDGHRLDLKLVQAGLGQALLYYKPIGEVTTRRDPQGRPTVFDRLPAPRHGRWIVVGRLDVNTAGLLLFTTDGELAHRLMHPSSRIEREYLVRLRGRPRPETIKQLLRGVELDDGPAAFDRIELSSPQAMPGPDDVRNAVYRVVLHEGRNREVRRLWEAVGHEVSRLLRLRYGPVELPRDLKPGDWRYLNETLSAALAGMSASGGRPGRDPAQSGANSAPKTH